MDMVSLMKCFLNEVLFVAPTGKARSIITKRTGSPAFTLHSAWYRLHNNSNFFDTATTVVVDESSMVEMMLLSKLLSGLLIVNLKRLVLLGDQNQLPFIDDVRLAQRNRSITSEIFFS
jgi:ATP-dependent exoDNAse (exonuclease V) alpha subunit